MLIKSCLFLLFATSAYGHALAGIERILNGSTAIDGQFPYQASLRDRPNEHFCGGSIISASVILTAAHCTFMRISDFVVVVVGTRTITGLNSVHDINYIILHEDWDPNTLANDIALVKLRKPITFNSNKRIIELETNEVSDGTLSIVSGWGLTSIDGEYPMNLQYLESTIMNYVKCKERLPSSSAELVKSFNICGINKVGYSFCDGDSGGPLVVNGKQVGIVSWSDNCGDGKADVYTKVSYYINWINANK